jgi:hypothetical protein
VGKSERAFDTLGAETRSMEQQGAERKRNDFTGAYITMYSVQYEI